MSEATTDVIDPAKLETMLASADVTILDVRSPAEFENAHIAGSHNIPLDELKKQTDQIAASSALTHGADLVLVCQSGVRSEQAHHLLTSAGASARHLAGGIGRWSKEGRPVKQGRQTWDLERQVRFTAGSIVATSVFASTMAPRAKWVAAGIGTGLVVAASTNTCAMGAALARMPWNRQSTRPTAQFTQVVKSS